VAAAGDHGITEVTTALYESDRLPDCSGLDLLATMVAIVAPDGRCLWANASFERVLGLPRRSVQGSSLFEWCTDAQALRETVAAVSRNQYSSSRLETRLRPPEQPGAARFEPLAVQAIVNQIDASPNVIVELVEVEQKSRQDRAERASEQAQATKELVRNLAHEIRNPLGGIRGAAQLLESELDPPDLREYTQVIIGEADRLQALVDRLLAPHRQPQAIGDVNIHEVCERVLGLIEAEFPQGLAVVRDYDVSIPVLRGDREQLIQTLLNIVRNAAQALTERIAAGDACIVVRTRVARQVTFAGQRHRLALDLRVEDNGGGVAEAIRERIFYPLVSARAAGSGLGLTLARSFVQQHGGTIEFESAPGRTVFKVLIPLH
jgi:two-component system nitrogen regulation sensor histidine kinase GlnL